MLEGMWDSEGSMRSAYVHTNDIEKVGNVRKILLAIAVNPSLDDGVYTLCLLCCETGFCHR